MSSNRVIYQNWIADLGRDPDLKFDPDSRDHQQAMSGSTGREAAPDERLEKIRTAVAAALDKLSENEREFIERYYFMGRSYREISELSGRAIHRLEALHQRAIKKLLKALSGLVNELYGLTPARAPNCPICASPERLEIDRLIASRDLTATWRPVMQLIAGRFGVTIRSPQTVIGHEKYH
jgi:hypothetical protein